MHSCSAPVAIVGDGCRRAGIAPLLAMGIPVLSSWQAADLIDNRHPNYFGRPGVYGQRAANKILFAADTVISIGCRLSPFTIGHDGLRKDQALLMCDVDHAELHRFPKAKHYRKHASAFIEDDLHKVIRGDWTPWVARCEQLRSRYPWQEHDKTTAQGFVDSYAFVEEIQTHLKNDAVIVCDMGTALCAAYQVLRLAPPQRLLTSGGLGEMGCALPAAVGASFALDHGEVLCLHCDGGMMMNLQELQTIAHHNLPVKIIVFSNDGYGMLKHTQKTQGMKYAGVDRASGVSCPKFNQVAYAFGIESGVARTWEDVASALPQLFAARGPALLEVITDPEQSQQPKVSYEMVDGAPRYSTIDRMSPLLQE